jgi:type IV pilus assembly protein PilB
MIDRICLPLDGHRWPRKRPSSPPNALSGVARVLVNAGKISSKTAEDLLKSARDRKSSFVSAVVAAGAVSPADLAHTLSTALALPCST